MTEKYLAQLIIDGQEVEDPTGFSSIQPEVIISWAISIMFTIGAVVALLYLIIGGIRWITSGGDSEQLARARNTIIFAIVGLGAVFIAVFVVKFVADILGIPFLTFSDGGGGGGDQNF